jgi:hypothetical protein
VLCDGEMHLSRAHRSILKLAPNIAKHTLHTLSRPTNFHSWPPRLAWHAVRRIRLSSRVLDYDFERDPLARSVTASWLGKVSYGAHLFCPRAAPPIGCRLVLCNLDRRSQSLKVPRQMLLCCNILLLRLPKTYCSVDLIGVKLRSLYAVHRLPGSPPMLRVRSG